MIDITDMKNITDMRNIDIILGVLKLIGDTEKVSKTLFWRQHKQGIPTLQDFGLIFALNYFDRLSTIGGDTLPLQLERNDSKKLVAVQGEFVRLFLDEFNQPRIKLKVCTSMAKLNPKIEQKIKAECEAISRHFIDVGMLLLGKPFWTILPDNQLSKDLKNTASIAPFRNFGSLDSEGYDTACDVAVFVPRTDTTGLTTFLELMVIKRADLTAITNEGGDLNYAFVGGMLARGGLQSGNIMQMTLELLEETIISSMRSSTFYLNILEEMLKSTQSVEAALDEIDNCDVTTAEGRKFKTNYIMNLMDQADGYMKSKDPTYKSTRELIMAEIFAVTKANGEQLICRNTLDHRSTPAGMNKSQMYYLYLDTAKINNILPDRGLRLSPGDDAVDVKTVSFEDFANNSWSHLPFLMNIISTFLERRNTPGSLPLKEEENTILDGMLPKIIEYIDSQGLFSKVNTLLNKLVQEFEQYLQEEKKQEKEEEELVQNTNVGEKFCTLFAQPNAKKLKVTDPTDFFNLITDLNPAVKVNTILDSPYCDKFIQVCSTVSPKLNAETLNNWTQFIKNSKHYEEQSQQETKLMC